MKINEGFTLAEVLITLVIIGIIAAITVPVIMANHRKTETAVKLKKFYSNMSNVIKLSETYHGIPSREWEKLNVANSGFEIEKSFLDEYILKYVNYIKVTPLGDNSEYVERLYYSENAGNSSAGCLVQERNAAVYLNDGSMFFVCENLPYIGYDINSDKKGPNLWGKDVFQFAIKDPFVFSTDDKNVPSFYTWYNTQDKSYSREEVINLCKNCSNCNYCTWLIQIDGWEIKDDYPWKI